MGFIDKVKSGIKTGADKAATKAQVEYEKIQARRELAQAHEALGAKTFELAEGGDISHPELTPLVEQVRSAKAKLEPAGSTQETAAAAPEAEQPAATEAAPDQSAEEPPPAT
jgi:hypothetical protein